jgi:hypothetical protein
MSERRAAALDRSPEMECGGHILLPNGDFDNDVPMIRSKSCESASHIGVSGQLLALERLKQKLVGCGSPMEFMMCHPGTPSPTIRLL